MIEELKFTFKMLIGIALLISLGSVLYITLISLKTLLKEASASFITALRLLENPFSTPLFTALSTFFSIGLVSMSTSTFNFLKDSIIVEAVFEKLSSHLQISCPAARRTSGRAKSHRR